MGSKWNEVSIGDICELGDGAHARVQRTTTGVPYLTSRNIGSGVLNLEKVDHISREDYNRLFPLESRAVTRLKPGDILTGIIGTFGNLYIYKDNDEFGISSAIAILRPDQTKVWPRYLYYYLSSSDFRQKHFSYAAGSVQGYTNLPTIRQLPAILPPLPEQRRIAKILGDLDDKIELNRTMNETLEAMARALFKSWFVDFDPVRAKMEGRQPEGMDAETAALFPDKLVESEMGMIPEGWEVTRIESLCDVITSGGTPARSNKAYWEPATVPWFKTGELLDGPLIDAEEKISIKGLANSSCKLWPAGTILFALYASPTVGRFGVLTKPGTANQAAAALIAKPAYGVPFLMGILYEARAELQRVAIGAAQQNINQGVLKNHVVVAPLPALANAYSDNVAPWFEQRIKLAEQSRSLATLRDTLLPGLMSGEIVPPSL